MNRHFVLAFGVVAYLVFFATFLYLIGFIGGFAVPKTLSSGTAGALWPSVAMNVGLLLLFAVPHTIMARPSFKKRWTRLVPDPIERSTYVLIASLLIVLLIALWQPLPASVWQIDTSAVATALWVLYGIGWGLVLYSSFVIDHFDLFGLRQVVLYWRGREYTHPEFSERFPYNHVRHPLMLGWIVVFWATPQMSAGHLLFAGVWTAYILVGIAYEERDLKRYHPPYEEYRQRVPGLIPKPRAAKPGEPKKPLAGQH